MPAYDALVVGLGAFGSATLYHLAKAGLRVAGIERYHPSHAFGSSHGASRIIRLAYFEGPQYVPLLRRSYRLFKELEEEAGVQQQQQRLFLRTGMLDVGAVFSRSLSSARLHGLSHEVLTGEQLNSRFPGYRVPEHWQALFQPDGGVLAPERIIQAHVSLAERHGAHVLSGERVVHWQAGGGGGGVRVTTDKGNGYSAGQVVLAAGPWMGQLVPELQALCVPERQVVGWFQVDPAAQRSFAPSAFPVFVIEDERGAAYYGFPEHGEQPGFKIGLYHHLYEKLSNPDNIQRQVNPADEAALRAGVSSYFPSANGPMLSYSTCMFTNTPDGHFIIDRHPRHPQVVLCSACSGHGFKMSSGVGQLLAQMVVAGGGGGGGGSGHASGTAAGTPPRPATAGPGSGRTATAAAAGTCGADDELALHRISPSRPGHPDALRRFEQQ